MMNNYHLQLRAAEEQQLDILEVNIRLQIRLDCSLH